MCQEPGLRQCPPLGGTNTPQKTHPPFTATTLTQRHGHNEASGGFSLCRRLFSIAIVSASDHVLEKEISRLSTLL